mgnify:CR=1 FL=1
MLLSCRSKLKAAFAVINISFEECSLVQYFSLKNDTLHWKDDLEMGMIEDFKGKTKYLICCG